MSGGAEEERRNTDRMLWLAGGVVAAMALVWLLIWQPWSTGTSGSSAPAVAEPAAAAAPNPRRAVPDAQPAAVAIENPLRMARLAYEAGMLIEPEEYSAWSLYGRVLERDPEHAEALQGIALVADGLLERASSALAQGRFEDARATVERVTGVPTVHERAESLLGEIDAAVAAAEARERAAARQRREARTPPQAPPAEETPEPEPEIDLAAQAHDAFELAMSEERLLTPADRSARYFVDRLTEIDPAHALTLGARRALFEELLARAALAIESLDTDAARTWIEEAAQLRVDAAAVAEARGALTDSLIAMESQRPLPIGALKLVDYTAPAYPVWAARRDVSGWVDVEFTVLRDGATRDIVISDSSHEAYFRRESVEAIEQWRFEPRVFMGRAIDQRVFTRINFDLDD